MIIATQSLTLTTTSLPVCSTSKEILAFCHFMRIKIWSILHTGREFVLDGLVDFWGTSALVNTSFPNPGET